MGVEPTAPARRTPPDLVPRRWLAEEIEASLAETQSRSVAGDSARMVLLIGQPGSGKTVLAEQLTAAWSCANYLIRPGTTEPIRHLDGVAAPQLRQDPLTAGQQAAASVPSIDLDTDALYLQSEDIPEYLGRVDHPGSRILLSGDYAFDGCDGVHRGFRVWDGEVTDALLRLTDIRFVFPDAERAAAYHAERLLANSEGYPPIEEAPLVGDDCHVFGGTFPTEPTKVEMAMYFYVFRVQNVVVKLFAAQGVQSPERLTLDHMRPIAERSVARIEQAL